MLRERQIIDLDSSDETDSEEPLINLEDWKPSNGRHDTRQDERTSFAFSETAYEKCLNSIVALFPDISHDYIQELYAEHSAATHLAQADQMAEMMIGRILDQTTYPKSKKDQHKDLKRKRSGSQLDDKAEAAEWKAAADSNDLRTYAKIARAALLQAFPRVPTRYIDARFKEHKHVYGTFLDVADTERHYDQIASPPYSRLKAPRLPPVEDYDDLLSRVGLSDRAKGDKLRLEIQVAQARRLRDNNAFEVKSRALILEIAREQEERDRGEVFECGCCFDSIPMSKMTQCNADSVHFFCFGCARMNAENDIGMNKFALSCMDGSGCLATFSRAERAKFLSPALIAKLDGLEQQASIQGALSGSFDFVTCPFCEYGHICPPVEEDREFRCGNPDCKEISCRLCKERSHVPLTCKEYRQDRGLNERHIIEEARTEALLRSCPKCKVRILKDDGCNKVVCTTCGSALCDYCGKDITLEKYAHFEGQHPAIPQTQSRNKENKCPLYDKTTDRKHQQITAAEQQARENVRETNPEISEADLEIKFSDKVNEKNAKSDHRRRQHHHMPVPRYNRDPLGEALLRQPLLPQNAVPEAQRPMINDFPRLQAALGMDPVLNGLPNRQHRAEDFHALRNRMREQDERLRRQYLEFQQMEAQNRRERLQHEILQQMNAAAQQNAGFPQIPYPQLRNQQGDIPFAQRFGGIPLPGAYPLGTPVHAGINPQAGAIPFADPIGLADQPNAGHNINWDINGRGARRDRHRHAGQLG